MFFLSLFLPPPAPGMGPPGMYHHPHQGGYGVPSHHMQHQGKSNILSDLSPSKSQGTGKGMVWVGPMATSQFLDTPHFHIKEWSVVKVCRADVYGGENIVLVLCTCIYSYMCACACYALTVIMRLPTCVCTHSSILLAFCLST